MFNPDGCFCCLPPEDPCTTSNCTFLSNEMSDFEINPYWTQVTGSGAVGNGSYTVTNAQDNDVGNDAPCRRVTVETDSATTSADNVYVVCWKKSSSHNPSTQCPVTSLTFCVESKRVSESDGQVRFFIKQNGSTYVTRTGFSIGVNWKRATGTFSQSDFEELSSGAQPNFTATGTAIEFGFGLKIQVNSGDEPFADVWFDNMCVVVTKQCAGSACGANCQELNTGSSGVSVLGEYQASGNPIQLNYSSDQNVGVPAPSHRFDFTRSAADLSGKVAHASLSIGSLLSGCISISEVSVCCQMYGENDSSFSNRTGYVYLGIHQGGYFYFEPSQLQNASPFYATKGAWVVASKTINTGLGLWIRYPESNPGAGGATTTSGPDFSQDFEIAIRVGSGGGLMVQSGTVFIDNVCVKATCDTSGCVISQPSQCSDDMEVSFSAPPFPSVLGPHSATLTYFNSVFAGGVVVTRPPSGPEATANPAIWEFTDFGPSPSFPGTDYGIRIQVSPVTSGGTCKFRILTLAYDRRPAGSQAFLAGTYINWQSGTITDCDAPFTGGLPAIGRGDGFVMSTSCIPTVTPIV